MPHKLKIKKLFKKAENDEHSEESLKRQASHGSPEEETKTQSRKLLDAEISKGDIKMRAALDSYLSVSESDNEEQKHGKPLGGLTKN